MRTTSFGQMQRLTLHPMARDCEVMHFDRSGKPHSHKRMELAICTSGSGVVVIDAVPWRVSEGVCAEIPAGSQHHMVPDDDVTMCMLIAYVESTDD